MFETIRRNALLMLAKLLVWLGDAGRRIQRAEEIHDDAFTAIDPKSLLSRFTVRCEKAAKLKGKARSTAAKRLLTYLHTQGNPLTLSRVFTATLSDAI